jgi:DNA-binding CsgD family transcriptional regulator
MAGARLRIALAALGAALGIYAIALAVWEPDALTLPAAVHVAIGWSFVAAGLVAWTRRPENRTGLLMTLTGIVWFGRDFDWFDFGPATRLSELLQNVFLALIAHQVIVFPDGVARARAQRVLVGAVYALAIPGYAVSKIGDLANTILSAVAIALAVAVVFLVVERWRTASAPRRRALEPVLWAGPAALVVAAISIARDYIGISLSPAADTALDWCALVYTAIPAAFLLGVLRTRLRRAALGDLVLDLSEVTSPARVRDALARSLGDPSLQLAFAHAGGYRDLEGHPFELPHDGGRAVTVLEGLAALIYDRSLLEDPTLVEAAGAAARLALDNARLQTGLRAQLEAGPTDGALAELTARELEVLALLAEGRTDRGIAQRLYVTPKTVEAHVRSIFRKLDLPSDAMENRRVHAVLAFLRTRSS